MRLPRFELIVPSSLHEAAEVLKAKGAEAEIIAGGTDLLVRMKQRNVAPGFLVDVKGITQLAGIGKLSGGGLNIGPATRLSDIASSPEVTASYPALAKAAGTVGSFQIRNRGTIGGNVCLEPKCYYIDQSSSWWSSQDRCRKRGGERCHIVPSSTRGCFALFSGDTVPALIAYKAVARLSGPEAEREVPLEDLYTGKGIGHLDLRPGEILSGIWLPPADVVDAVFFKFAPRDTIDFATVAVAASLRRAPNEVRIVAAGVSSGPQRLKDAEDLFARDPAAEIADEAGRAAADRLRIISWVRGPVAYKKEMVRLLVKDAVRQLQGRATS